MSDFTQYSLETLERLTETLREEVLQERERVTQEVRSGQEWKRMYRQLERTVDNLRIERDNAESRVVAALQTKYKEELSRLYGENTELRAACVAHVLENERIRSERERLRGLLALLHVEEYPEESV